MPNSAGDLPSLLTTTQVAELVSAAPETVRYWRHVGRGPKSFRPQGTRRVLYRREDVLAWLQLDAAETSAIGPVKVG